MVEFFGKNMFGKVVDYRWRIGYDAESIRKYELSFCPPSGPDEPFSEILRAHNMAEYGSDGLPEFVLKAIADKRINSAMSLDRRARDYVRPEFVGYALPFVKTVQELKERSVDFEKLAWFRAAISIEMCWRVSTALDKIWGDWLLKVAVHAACTLESMQGGGLESPLATIKLFQLAWEIGYGLLYMLRQDLLVCPQRAAVAAMLIEAWRGFSSAGLCLISTENKDEKNACFFHGLAILSASDSTSATSSITESGWKELARRRIKSTNFCPSRQLTVNVEIHRHHMFHLIARAEYLTTSRKLHSACGDTCVKAFNTDNHHQAGHLNENCGCSATYFEPIETEELVLFDTEGKEGEELVLANSHTPYVAVSQIWFQGIFGQSSRRCGECSLGYLKMACTNIGARYAWIDTLCMPTSMDLRRKVIRQLRSIYLNAAATLVIDVGLISTAAKTVMDLSLAICLSDWSSRVWTLQEGVLASKLLFCVGEQVLALPQVDGPLLLQDTRRTVPSALLKGYGQREIGLNRPLDSLLQLAAGRQTSYPCDYLYGLSALLPSTPANRNQDPNLLAIEVAQMYQSPMGIDLTILQTSFDRCRTEGYRWMPLGAKTAGNLSPTHIIGRVNEKKHGGLECRVKALIGLTSVVGIYKEAPHLRRTVQSVLMFRNFIMYWYSTETAGVFVGTSVEADRLVFCLVGYVHDLGEDGPFGFVVSPTTHCGRPAYQYIGAAVVIGKVPANPSIIFASR
ncbi:hypothetical protein BGX26_011688 [Mortierella sp. AD094]|nr:hypothetical protein BGX26_011688 [Mortierella sp. AD094]